MKNSLKQIGKALCYVILFMGSQFLVSFAMQMAYGVKIGAEAAKTGVMPEEEEIVAKITEFLLQSVNIMTFVSGILTLGILWIFFLIRKKKFTEEVSLRRFDKSKILPIIVLGAASSIFVGCFMSLIPLPQEVLESYAESSQMLTGGSTMMILFSTIIVAPIVEEVVFRGLVFSRLKKAMNVWVAILISSLLFGLMHGQMLWTSYTFVFGIMLAVVANQMNSIGASILLHMSFNAFGMFAGLQLTAWQMILVTVITFVVMVAMLYLILMKQDTEKEIEMKNEAETNEHR